MKKVKARFIDIFETSKEHNIRKNKDKIKYNLRVNVPNYTKGEKDDELDNNTLNEDLKELNLNVQLAS